MPSKQWMDQRRQVKVWLTEAEYQALKAECAARNITIATLLRQYLAAIRAREGP